MLFRSGEDDKTPAAPGTGEAPSHATSHHTRRSTRHHTTSHESTPKAEPKPATRRKSTPKDLGAALAQAAGKPAHEKSHSSSGGGSTAPFNRGAASSALSRVNVQSCKRAGGPTGAGHVTITFAPSGSVKTATVDRGPFPGTSTGGCIAGKYRGAHIPAFSGGPVRVGKSFSIH